MTMVCTPGVVWVEISPLVLLWGKHLFTPSYLEKQLPGLILDRVPTH